MPRQTQTREQVNGNGFAEPQPNYALAPSTMKQEMIAEQAQMRQEMIAERDKTRKMLMQTSYQGMEYLNQNAPDTAKHLHDLIVETGRPVASKSTYFEFEIEEDQ